MGRIGWFAPYNRMLGLYYIIYILDLKVVGIIIMKKAIAKLANAIRDRRDEKRKTTEIEIGEVYHVKHTMRRDFYIKVQEAKGVWVEGFAMDAKTMQPGEEIIVRRELCTFTQLKDKK